MHPAEHSLFGPPDESPITQPGEIVGRVDLIPGVPLRSSYTVAIEGAPISAISRPDGTFDLRNMPPGAWTMLITFGTITKQVMVASNSGVVTDAGAIVLSAPGSISGHVGLFNAADIASTIVGIPELGLFAPLNPSGYFLLTGVAPGPRVVSVVASGATTGKMYFFLPISTTVEVLPLTLTTGITFNQERAILPVDPRI